MGQKISYGLASVLVLAIISFIVMDSTKSNNTNQNAEAVAAGAQVLTLSAVASGYSPQVLTAKANQPIALTFKSEIAGGCQSSLVFPSLNISKVVKPFGETIIAIPAQKAGTTLEGTCSMGMFNMQIKVT